MRKKYFEKVAFTEWIEQRRNSRQKMGEEPRMGGRNIILHSSNCKSFNVLVLVFLCVWVCVYSWIFFYLNSCVCSCVCLCSNMLLYVLIMRDEN